MFEFCTFKFRRVTRVASGGGIILAVLILFFTIPSNALMVEAHLDQATFNINAAKYHLSGGQPPTAGLSLVCFDLGYLAQILTLEVIQDQSFRDLVNTKTPVAQKAFAMINDLRMRAGYVGSFCGESYTVSDPSKLVKVSDTNGLTAELNWMDSQIQSLKKLLSTVRP